jgi:hypothetical protein
MSAGFWFAAGVLTGVASAVGALPLWRACAGMVGWLPLRYGLAAGAVATFATSAVLIYLTIGSPRAVETSAAAATAHPAPVQAPSGAKAQSMEAAAAGLEARLARGGGNADDWLLLAQSYDFLGRPNDAQRARARAVDAGASAPRSAAAPSNSAMQPPFPVQVLQPVEAPRAVSSSEAAMPRDSTTEPERKLSNKPRDSQ